jgi:hypothetical protein
MPAWRPSTAHLEVLEAQKTTQAMVREETPERDGIGSHVSCDRAQQAWVPIEHIDDSFLEHGIPFLKKPESTAPCQPSATLLLHLQHGVRPHCATALGGLRAL